jgi:hypothetical protein
MRERERERGRDKEEYVTVVGTIDGKRRAAVMTQKFKVESSHSSSRRT